MVTHRRFVNHRFANYWFGNHRFAHYGLGNHRFATGESSGKGKQVLFPILHELWKFVHLMGLKGDVTLWVLAAVSVLSVVSAEASGWAETAPVRTKVAEARQAAVPREPVVSMEAVVRAETVAGSRNSAAPRVLPPGQKPKDSRFGPLKDLNGYFPMQVVKTPEEWQVRAERLRRQVLVAAGLWPMPTKTPLNAVIHGRVDRPEYTVEKVYFESFPGYYVTGNLYRPKNRSGPGPAVLCPHGHWPNGRFYDAGEKQLAEQIKKGEEKYDPCGRFPLQARCVQLARMGCTVFLYDMVGYADCQQLAHRAGVRPEMNTLENWGFFSPQAELHLQSIFGLQTYNSIRALDWLSQLDGVDPKRIGVTGASGGGTQTFILCAVDDRPAVAVPAVMVSTAMQGGCTCENACYLRIGAGNIDLAALTSPRPLGLIAANDWTKEMETKGFPELKAHYTMLGVPDRVALWAFLQFPHNYNYVSRSVMYPWMNRHLGLGQKEPIVEQPFQPLSREEMTVWDQSHPRPTGGPEFERKLLRWWTQDAENQLRALTPKDPAGWEKFRQVLGGAVDVMIGRRLPQQDQVEVVALGGEDRQTYRLEKLLLRYKPAQEEVPALLLRPRQWQSGRLTLVLHPEGKQALFDAQGQPIPLIQELLQKQADAVLLVDLFGQGEFTDDGKPMLKQPLVASGKEPWQAYAGYTYGYNHPLFSKRVHDAMTALIAARQPTIGAKTVRLWALAGAGRWGAALCAMAQIGSSDKAKGPADPHGAGGSQAPAALEEARLQTGRFRFRHVNEIDHADFLPGGGKYLDLPGLLALAAPMRLVIEEETPADLEVVQAAYRAAGARDRLRIVPPTR